VYFFIKYIAGGDGVAYDKFDRDCLICQYGTGGVSGYGLIVDLLRHLRESSNTSQQEEQ
jgi:hypothetical protein